MLWLTSDTSYQEDILYMIYLVSNICQLLTSEYTQFLVSLQLTIPKNFCLNSTFVLLCGEIPGSANGTPP
jgi:hypothetical protein